MIHSHLTDVDLIGQALSRCSSQVTSGSFLSLILADIDLDESSFYSPLKNGTLVDIGNGGFAQEYEQSSGLSALHLKEIILVDPHNTPYPLASDPRIRSVESDGLSFMKSMPSKSTHVFTSGLDGCILGVDSISLEYCKRLVDEIYRVLPEQGMYISCSSPALEVHAYKRFSPDKIQRRLRDLSAFEK